MGDKLLKHKTIGVYITEMRGGVPTNALHNGIYTLHEKDSLLVQFDSPRRGIADPLRLIKVNCKYAKNKVGNKILITEVENNGSAKV